MPLCSALCSGELRMMGALALGSSPAGSCWLEPHCRGRDTDGLRWGRAHRLQVSEYGACWGPVVIPGRL